ncbi:hypothetical protein [Amycolatopsis sp. YIM 10]|uniref:hypothetical protein n=1 Tax=Amycolatopsis sp. YIM 10 TaxID=2653857 RepID=UPI00128FF0F5|nr:hypothetical protein [Amycolatopsis sp. YIM 10]QFU89679.1 hypothetical protein YIM_22505 [Amycolatopsis sp. YIM 10]
MGWLGSGRSGASDDLRALARSGNWQSLWWQILRLPLPRAAAAAAHLKVRKWKPPSEADARLATVLTGLDATRATEVGDSLFGRTTVRLPGSMGIAKPGFSVRHPVVAIEQPTRSGNGSRVVTVDRAGVRSTLYEGPAQHWSMCALDSETVIVRREFDGGGWRGDTEIVEYSPAGEVVLASGSGFLDAVVEPTATGFVVGTKLAGAAFALADGEQEQLDLGRFGFRRADLFAVNSNGTRIAFADGRRLLITDSRLQPLHETVVESLRHGEINAITFTEDSIITAGYDKGLYRWQVIGGKIRGLHSERLTVSRTFFTLNPVTPWNLLVAEGGNVNFHYDIGTLDRCAAPDFLEQSGTEDSDDHMPRAVGKFASTAYSRLAVYEGGLTTRGKLSVDAFYSTIVQDLEHPLNLLVKPVSALTPGDAGRVLPHLDQMAGTPDPHSLTDPEKGLLRAAVEACALAPALAGP